MTGTTPARGKDWPRAIFWDLDGTLAHTLPDLADSVDDVMSGLTLAPCGEKLVRTWIGGGVENLVRQALLYRLGASPATERFGEAMGLFEKAHEKNNGRKARLYPGIRELLDRQLRERRRLACITNKAERYTLPLLRKLGLGQLFVLTVCGDTTTAKKPDPLPLQHALNRLRLLPDEVLHIGDSENDIKAARAAGISVIGVSYGYCRGEMRALAPDKVAHSPAELHSLIG